MRALLTLLLLLAAARPAQAVDYRVKQGDTLASVAANLYGNSAYRLMLEKYNRFPSGGPLAPGVVVRAPELKFMVIKDGLSRQVESDLDMIIAARYRFLKIENEVRKAIAWAPAGKPAPMPATVGKTLKEIAADLEGAGQNMAKKGAFAGHSVRVRQRLEECGAQLKKLANGQGDDKAIDAVHRLIAQTFVKLIAWARNEPAT